MSDTDAIKPPVVGNITFKAGDSQASKQLRYELDGIASNLNTLQDDIERHGYRMNGHKEELDEHGDRLDAIEAKLPGYSVATRLDAMAQGQEQQVLNSVDALSSVRQRLDALETRTAKLPVMTAENGDKVPVSMTPSSVTVQAFERLDALEARVEGLSKSGKLTRTNLEALDDRIREVVGQWLADQRPDAPKVTAGDRTQATNRQHVAYDAQRRQLPSGLPTIYTGTRTPPPTQVAHGDIWLHPERGRLKDEFGLWVPAPAPQARQVDLDEIESLRQQLKDAQGPAGGERWAADEDLALTESAHKQTVDAMMKWKGRCEKANEKIRELERELAEVVRERDVAEDMRRNAATRNHELQADNDRLREKADAAVKAEPEQLGDWHPADWGCPEPEQDAAQTARDTGDI